MTVCIEGHEILLGKIIDGKMRLNEVGQMVNSVWNELPLRYPGIETDEFAIMPNHIHGIIILNVGAGPCACSKKGQPRGVAPTLKKMSLPSAVHRFKSMVTTHYRKGIIQKNWRYFDKRVWQRNYYEHIIRNDESLNKIREYIITNPQRWHLDRNNPDHVDIDAFDRWLESFKKPPIKGMARHAPTKYPDKP